MLDILATEDEEWKHNILNLIAQSPNKPDPELLSVIKRMAERPTVNEKDEDIDWKASQIMEANE